MWIRSEGEVRGEGQEERGRRRRRHYKGYSRAGSDEEGVGEEGGRRGGETINAPHSAGGAHPAPLREKLAWVVYAGGGAGGGAQVAGSVPPARPSSGPDRRICHLRAGRATAHGLQQGCVGEVKEGGERGCEGTGDGTLWRE